MKNIKNTKQRITTWIDPEVVKLAKSKGALEDKELSEIVEDSLRDYSQNIVEMMLTTKNDRKK